MSNGQNDLYDESGHCKEVYVWFGLAYYESGVIESGIANALLYGEFLVDWKTQIDRNGKSSFNRREYEKAFDAYLKCQFSQTFGNLVARLSGVYGISAELKDALEECKKQRNYLAHHYFRERAAEFVTRKGRDSMIAELSALSEKFRNADQHICEMQKPLMQKLGIREDTLRLFVEEFAKKAYSGEPV